MMPWYRTRTLYLGLGLILVANAVVLGTVWDNRSAEPDSTLSLTDRELALPNSYRRGEENSGLDLHLVWRTEESQSREFKPGVMYLGGGADWLDAAKLAELGIDVRPRAPNPRTGAAFSTSLPADVLLVLEMDGAAYRRTLERACREPSNAAPGAPGRQYSCREETNRSSRLFVVDAGLDRKALRKKYPDRHEYALVHGQIQASLITEISGRRLSGYVRGLSNDDIDVPLKMRSALGIEPAAGRLYGQPDKPFAAVVTFGRRLEPWLAELSPRASQSN